MPMVDKWNGLAVLLTNLIEKYAVDLDIESLPDRFLSKERAKNVIPIKMFTKSIKMFTKRMLKHQW